MRCFFVIASLSLPGARSRGPHMGSGPSCSPVKSDLFCSITCSMDHAILISLHVRFLEASRTVYEMWGMYAENEFHRHSKNRSEMRCRIRHLKLDQGPKRLERKAEGAVLRSPPLIKRFGDGLIDGSMESRCQDGRGCLPWEVGSHWRSPHYRWLSGRCFVWRLIVFSFPLQQQQAPCC